MQFQGDIGVNFVGEYNCPLNAIDKSPKKHKLGTIVSEGEGKNHFHVLTGEDVVISKPKSMDGVRTWSVFAPKGAVLTHVDKDGKKTGDHGDIALRAGVSTLFDQREQSYATERPVRGTD